MDIEKIEGEFEFYGFSLDALKKERKSLHLIQFDATAVHVSFSELFCCLCFSDEKLFRAHCKKLIDKFTNNVIDAAQRDITIDTTQLESFANNSMNLIKPETVKFLSKTNALIDKHFAIPPNLPTQCDEDNNLQNTPDMDDYELKCKKDIAELEMVYKQQSYFASILRKELELYDEKLMDVVKVDDGIIGAYEKYFADANAGEETIDAAIQMLDDGHLEPKDA